MALPHPPRPLTWSALLCALAANPLTALPESGTAPRLERANHLDEGDEQYRLLAGLIEKGLFELAASEGEKFLSAYGSHPKSELARYRLATAQFELERLDAAAKNYRPLVASEGFEYRAEAAFRLGQCELRGERLDRASRAFRLVLELDQSYLEGPATFFLGETAFRQGDTEAARTSYRTLVQRFASSEYVAAARRGLAWCAWQEGDLEETVRSARSFLERHGDEEDADEVRVLLGEALLENEDHGPALAAFASVRSAAYRDAKLRGSAFATAAAGDHAGAAQLFETLARELPESRFAAEARLQQGIQLLRAEEPRAALRSLRAIASNEAPETLYWLAQALDRTGESERALRTIERALAAETGESLATRLQIARGDVLTKLGRTEEAVGAYESGGSAYALYAAAVAALNDGEERTAVRLATTLLRSQADSEYATEARLVLGESLFALGEHERATEAFVALLEETLEPAQRAQAISRVGWCHYLTGDLSGAARRFGTLIEEHPDDPAAEEGLYMLGRVLVESERTGEATRVHTLYLKRHPDGPHADEVLYALARATDGAEGVPLFERLLARHADSDVVPRALVELGNRQLELGAVEDAARHFGTLLERHPQDELVPEARYGLAWARYQAGDFERSAELLRVVGASEASPAALREASWELCIWASSSAKDARGATEAWRQYVRYAQDENRRLDGARTVVAAWRDAGRPAEGQRVLEELLAMTSDRGVAVGVLLESAYLALEAGDVARAEAQVGAARARAPKDASVAEATFFVGEAYFTAGENARAAKQYERSLVEGSPTRTSALYKLGFARMRDDDLEGALEPFAQVVGGDRSHELWGESLFLHGEMLYRLERFEEAARSFALLCKEAPRHEVVPKARFRLGLAYGELGRWSDCEIALTKLAKEAPEFANGTEAELWRGRALSAQRKRRAARQAFERVVAQDEGELAAQARLGLGRLLEDEGRTEDALSEYFKVAFLYAHDEEVAEALYRAGTCLETMGDTDKALEQYREVLESHPDARYATEARKGIERLRS